MCGINGVISFAGRLAEDSKREVERMNAQIIHRGPDEEGCFSDPYCGIGMRRLSIIDLSSGGQPIFNETSRKLIVLNGEIYNYRELREHIIGKGHRLSTASDTEVVLHLFEEYGANSLEMLKGMFAFAIYDMDSRELFIARDRAGEKPLYYCRDDSGFCFSSELKSITKGLGKTFSIDRHALNTYLSLTYIPAPMTIFQGVRKLQAGHWLKITPDEMVIAPYWDVRQNIGDGITGYDEAKKQIRTTMSQSVEAMMVSDVPLGAFLSGGVDSTIVTGLMSKVSKRAVKTFSVGFTIPDFDETEKARAVAEYHRTDHQVITLDYTNAISWLEKVLTDLDEPFADSSCIPTYYVSQFARDHVKVVLTGDGGDEMFAGYSKYLVDYYTRRYNQIPRIISEGIFEPVLNRLPDKTSLIRKLKKVVRSKNETSFQQRKRLMTLGFQDTTELLQPGYRNLDALNFIDGLYHGCGIDDELTRTLYTDMQIVLEGDMLAKVDRMSMLASLETRAPFLSKEMMELAFRIPSDFKIQGQNQKVVLKDAFSDFFPPGIMKQTKRGFGVPVGEWFKGPLKKELLDMLDEERLREQGIFNYTYIQRILDEHFSEKENHGFRLWTLYVFQKWMDNYYENGAERNGTV